MNQKDYWNKVSNKKEFTTPFQTDCFNKYISKDSVILDVGCGYGRILNELYNLGYKNLIGIDFSKGMIERGKKQYPYLDLRIKHNSSIDIPSKTINVIILFAVLTCITDNQEQIELINEIYRVLKDDGILYINDFLLNNDERNIKRYDKYKEKYNNYGIFELPEGAILRHHSDEWINELLIDFEPIKKKKLPFTTMNGNKSNGFYYFGRKI